MGFRRALAPLRRVRAVADRRWVERKVVPSKEQEADVAAAARTQVADSRRAADLYLEWVAASEAVQELKAALARAVVREVEAEVAYWAAAKAREN